jgi:tol-pal system protein YbgF
MMSRLALTGALVVLAAPVWAVNKDIERVQIQIAALQGQIADLQRTAEDNQREIKRLGDALTEQNAFLRKALQDRRIQDEALQTALREFGERMNELEQRLQQPAPASVPAVVALAPSADATALPPTGVPPAGPPAAAPNPAPVAPAAPPPPRELYSQAYADYARGNYDLAVQEYREYLRNYPNTDLSDNAQYWIGECYYSKQRYNEAVAAWNDLLRDFPASDKIPDARYKKGVTLERLGRRREALVEYRTVVERYPNSEAGRKAREKLNP